MGDERIKGKIKLNNSRNMNPKKVVRRENQKERKA